VSIAKALKIDGFMARDELTWLAAQARIHPLIAEVGSHKGRSTRALADNCRGVVYAIDPWAGYVNNDGSQARWIGDPDQAFACFKRNLKDHLRKGRVVICRTGLGEAVKGVLPFVDMVFIDGDHRYEQVRDDILLAKRILKPGGLLCGHDYGHVEWPGVQRAVNELIGSSRIVLRKTIWARMNSTTRPSLPRVT
jgi:hypothetical protein